MPIMIQNSKTKLMCAGGKIAKMYCQGDVIYSSGNIVTYIVRGVSYTQEYDEGQSVLSPSVVNPSLSGAAFLGWSNSPSSTSVISSLVMGDEPITLYAVFKYADAVVTSANGSYKFQDTVKVDETKTLYVLDRSKYESHTVTASVPQLNSGNATSGYAYIYAYVDGQTVRAAYVTSADTGAKVTEYEGYLGTGGKTFTITYAGNLTIRAVLGNYSWGKPTSINIASVKLNGKTVVG